MDKVDKRKRFENIILIVVLIVLVILVVIFYNKMIKKIKAEQVVEEEEVKLTDISYGSEITQLGKTNADGILYDFLNGYNQHSGETVMQQMDLVSAYIYIEEADSDIEKFDDKYVEILSNPENYDGIVLMQYTLPQQEQALIEAINTTDVKLELVDNTEIENVTKYLSKMQANIRTYSETEKVDQTDTLEFLLIHKENAYYVMNYYVVDENGNKIQ